jgi:hypothetical protein
VTVPKNAEIRLLAAASLEGTIAHLRSLLTAYDSLATASRDMIDAYHASAEDNINPECRAAWIKLKRALESPP